MHYFSRLLLYHWLNYVWFMIAIDREGSLIPSCKFVSSLLLWLLPGIKMAESTIYTSPLKKDLILFWKYFGMMRKLKVHCILNINIYPVYIYYYFYQSIHLMQAFPLKNEHTFMLPLNQWGWNLEVKGNWSNIKFVVYSLYLAYLFF